MPQCPALLNVCGHGVPLVAQNAPTLVSAYGFSNSRAKRHAWRQDKKRCALDHIVHQLAPNPATVVVPVIGGLCQWWCPRARAIVPSRAESTVAGSRRHGP